MLLARPSNPEISQQVVPSVMPLNEGDVLK